MRKNLPVALAVMIFLVVVYVLDGIELPESSRLFREFTNAGHAPLFGVLSLAMLVLAKRFLKSGHGTFYPYVVSGVVSAGVGLVTEFVQYFTPRDASVLDMAYNLIGITTFLAVASSFEKGLYRQPILSTRARRNLVRLLSVLLLSVAFFTFVTIFFAHARRRAQFPEILNFESRLEYRFVFTENADGSIVDPPAEWNENSSGGTLRWTIGVGRISVIKIQYPYPVWTGYQFLRFDIFSPKNESLQIGFRVDDIRHNFEYEDRFNRSFAVAPGANHFSIPLSEIETAPARRKMDMTSIANIMFLAGGLDSSTVLYLDNLRLE